jgi:SAM-dependent methyltransferase
VLATMLSATLPVTYIDYRALRVSIPGMTSLAGDLTRLPLRDRSVESLSCIHVAEHVGLGRYGDPIDPAGTRRAAAELARVLAPGGRLYFALPVGQPRVEFNAHRVHAATQIVDYFSELQLEEYSGIGDDRRYYEHVPLDRFARDRYACGLFVFTRP